MTDRVSYVDACRAMRGVLDDAAHATPPLRTREWRLLTAVLYHTASWSKLRDHVAHEVLAETSGISHPRNLARELASLRARGLIVYQPGASPKGGNRTLSVVGLPRPPVDTDPLSPPVDTDPGSTPTPGQSEARPPVDLAPRPPVDTDPPTEKYREGTEKKTVGGADVDDEFSDDVRRLTRQLAARVHANGHKIPKPGSKAHRSWFVEVDRLLRLDGADPREVASVIDWATADDFWRANIRSAGKLRTQYSQLRLHRRRSNGHQPGDLRTLGDLDEQGVGKGIM